MHTKTVKFKRGDRVRDVNHEWTPAKAEFGAVTHVDAAGSVHVDWDDEDPCIIPNDPITLALVQE